MARRLSSQLKDGKVCVKLYVREPLHAKLYLAHRPDDNFNKIQAILGSSNLTYASMSTKLQLVQYVDRGVMTPNEVRYYLNMAPIDGGDQALLRKDTGTLVKGGENE